ncbi:MAG: hypothetical protein US57_C0006G0060 [Candidatus Moranbacteria bacterium GW2011_GWC2_37_73]|nr:MAG: hypothetical protein UR95_C0007G0063 [Parcubacteria group bacterium GW2011_GWC1_36_108]KKQ00851.1 MAG: hypothetical protein US09_C0005G0017 [Candidatus Moranbacteria bacterium GW2011_GWD1_36_198]KKQ02284.1 MAG: hypothetical protein US10_C0004G0017 [Candidatus Moranbacteria bacterium GW2011_GWD2_36_198]KKQ39988.1 MAG: hypothetical protein US57_C0006G0060 [Candidatus Moranbacteria bacterium GW2011_GWC2_37_73]HAR99853.1 hypothetical protein [Candidatus Moranbacteria bacterium]
MNFTVRKFLALILTIGNVFLAVFLHGYEYGLIVLVLSLLMLVAFIWFKDFFAKVVTGFYRNNPVLLEFTGWIFLILFLIFSIIAK